MGRSGYEWGGMGGVGRSGYKWGGMVGVGRSGYKWGGMVGVEKDWVQVGRYGRGGEGLGTSGKVW